LSHNPHVLDVLAASPRLMRILRLVRDLDLPDAWVGAGAVRSVYWAYRHHQDTETVPGDIDVVYCDPSDTTKARDATILARLPADLPWEVTNQARKGATSTQQAISRWPELCTCVAARIDTENNLHLLAPHGTGDLLALRWRANPSCQDPTAFARRVMEKRIAERWPLVRIG
jgi:hypothetical protein